MNPVRPDISNRYEIISSLGEGGMGAVYLAMDLELHRKVAVKVIKKEVVANQQIITRTIREGKILSQLRHPGIASVYEMNVKGPVPYIVQEYISGQDLGSYIEKGIFLTAVYAWKLFFEQADVLAYIHGQGILHRDIKPENIIINDKGQSILMDFGLALSSEYTRMTREGNFVGTLKYCAPETLRGTEGSGPSTDIYQLATVVHECMCHKNVIGEFDDASKLVKILFARKWEDKPLNKRIPPPLAAVIKKCCSFDKELRPQNGTELKKLLLDVQRNGMDASELFHPENDGSAQSGKFFPRKDSDEGSPFPLGRKKAQKIAIIRKTAGAFLALMLLFVSVYGGMHFYSNPGPSENTVSPIINPFKNARYFLVLPKGFTMVIPFDKGDRLSWELKSEDYLRGAEAGVSGGFTRIAGGWKALVADLDCETGTSALLTIRDGRKTLGEKVVIFEEDIFTEPFKVRFSCDQISAQWKFNGFTNSTFVVEKYGNMPQGKPLQKSAHLQKWATTEETKRTVLFSKKLTENSCTLPVRGIEPGERLVVTLRVPFDLPEPVEHPGETRYVTSDGRRKDSPEASKIESGSLVALVKGTTNLTGRYPPSMSREIQKRIMRSGPFTGAKKLSTHISKVLINNDLIFLLTRGRILTCLSMNNDNQLPYKLLWRKKLDGRITSLIPSGSGVGCTGTGSGRSVRTYDRKGNETSKEINLFPPGSLNSGKRTLITAIKTIKDSSAIIISASMAGNNLLFLDKNNSDDYEMIDIPNEMGRRVTAFYGLGTVFYSYQGEKEIQIHVLNHFRGSAPHFELVAMLLNDPLRNTAPSMAFDNKRNVAMLCSGGILYQVVRSGNKFQLKKAGSWPVKVHAYKVVSLGEGRFSTVAISGLSDSMTLTPSELPELNLIESTYNEGSGKFESEFKTTDTTIFTEPHRCVVHGPVSGGNGRYCFTAGTQLFVYEFGTKDPVHNELTISTSAEMTESKNTAIITFGKEGEVFSLNLN